MQWGTAVIPLSEDQIDEVEGLFAEFYEEYEDIAYPGQIEFVDSLQQQFETKKFLTENQIAALTNVVNGCKERNLYEE